MAFIEIKFPSDTLGHGETVNVILPDSPREGGAKVLYLLHGHSDDYSTWMRRTSIERYATKYNIAVVMPDGNRSFYTNTASGHLYYDYIAHELPKKMEMYFNISNKPCDKYIAGLSMGGYGALKVALRECGQYAAAAGLSSAVDIKSDTINFALDPVFLGKPVPDEDDCFWLARQAAQKENRPRLFIGEGRQDFLYKDNENFRKLLDEIGYEYTYKESDGYHTWDFWDEYIPQAIEWMLK